MKSLSDIDLHLTTTGEKRIDVLSLPADSTNQHIISAQGSYYLSGPVAGVSGKNGISIQAGNVVLDLNGYQMTGGAGALSGIVVSGSRRSVQVRNGNVSQWGGRGIDLSAALGSIVADVVSVLNGSYGIYAGEESVVTRCVSRENTDTNIRVATNSNVTHCSTAQSNSGSGIDAGAGSLVADCNANNNGASGVVLGAGSQVSRVTMYNNTSHGLSLGPVSQAFNCVAESNGGNGFESLNNGHLVHCNATNNTGHGIHAQFTPTIDGCICIFNGKSGILIDAGGVATITNNACHENGQTTANSAGIRVSVSGACRIERNFVTLNDVGLDILASRNVIVANTAASNTTANFNFVAGNHYGPMIDDTATDAANQPAVNGNSAPGDINSTSPWANFAH